MITHGDQLFTMLTEKQRNKQIVSYKKAIQIPLDCIALEEGDV